MTVRQMPPYNTKPNKNITATEARRITDKQTSPNQLYSNICNEIRAWSLLGNDELKYSVCNETESNITHVTTELEKAGFSVDRSKGSLYISW